MVRTYSKSVGCSAPEADKFAEFVHAAMAGDGKLWIDGKPFLVLRHEMDRLDSSGSFGGDIFFDGCAMHVRAGRSRVVFIVERADAD